MLDLARQAFLAIALLSAPLVSVADTSDAPRPSVLIILCDDLGYGDLAEQYDRAAEEPERLRELSTLLVQRYREARTEGPSWPVWQPLKKASGK